MGSPTMPADAAAWIRDVVLPLKYRRAVAITDDDLHLCPCQWSRSGHCAADHHEKCPRSLGSDRHGVPVPEAYITNSRGLVAVGAPTAWRTGRACRWLCPCRCHAEVTALFPAPPQRPGRASRTGGNNRIGATDRVRAWDDDPQLDLFGAIAPPRPVSAGRSIAPEETRP